MGTLITDTNMAAPDDFYEDLIGLHRGLTDAQSTLVNAKLILLLANHVGDRDVLRQATMGGGNDADVDRRQLAVGANPLDFTGLHEPQQHRRDCSFRCGSPRTFQPRATGDAQNSGDVLSGYFAFS